MKNYLKMLCAGVILGSGISVHAQDIHFSQFYENAILRNPALTGVFSGDYKLGVDYRNQWASITNPYTTVAVSAETRVMVSRSTPDYISFGFAAYYDKAGAINFTSQEILPAIAFNKSLQDVHNSYFSVGISGGYLSRFVDMSKMTFSSQVVNGIYSQNNASGENAPFKSLSNFDMGAGISLNSSIGTENNCNYYLGASLYHINHPTEIFNGGYSTIKLPMKWQFNAGINLIINERFSLALHANYADQQPYSEVIYGGLLTFHGVTPGVESNFAFSFGAFARYQDAIIPTIKLDFSNFSVGVSYDATNSSLTNGATTNVATNATEFSLILRGNYNHKKNPRDGVLCPRFEHEVYYPFHN